jgi:hypothetical protein
MLKKIATFLFCIVPSFIFAQSNADKLNIPINIPDSSFIINNIKKINPENISYGFQISPSISWLDVTHDDLQTDGAALNFRIGGVIEYKLLSYLKVVSGINYSNMAGYVYDNAVLTDNTLKDNFRINYNVLEVPVNLKIFTPTVNKTSYFLVGGFSGCFIIGATEKYKYVNSETKPLINGILSLTNASFVSYELGAGFSYNVFNKADFITKLSYKGSLTNIASGSAYTNNGRYNTDPKIYPGSLELSFGLMFHQKSLLSH